MLIPKDVPLVARAFELARECNSVREVKSKLRAEGYELVDAHLTGRLIRSQLNARLLPTDKARRATP